MRVGSYSSAHINDYAGAMYYYESLKPWRDRPYYGDDRPLHDRRKHTTGVHIRCDEIVCFRLHQTDVVEYHKDGQVHIYNWESRTTQNFAYAYTPPNVTSNFLLGYTAVGERIYRHDAGCTLRIGADGDVINPTPWTRRAVDMRAARKLRLEYGLDKLDDWMRAARSLNPSRFTRAQWGWMHFAYATETERKRVIADHSIWPTLAQSDVTKMTQAIYRSEGAWRDAPPIDYLTNLSQVKAYRASWKRFGKP